MSRLDAGWSQRARVCGASVQPVRALVSPCIIIILLVWLYIHRYSARILTFWIKNKDKDKDSVGAIDLNVRVESLYEKTIL